MAQTREEQIKIIHVLLKECGIESQKSTIASSFSDERTASVSELTAEELVGMVKYLQDSHDVVCRKMRGKVTHYLTLLGWVIQETGKPDWRRIDEYIKNIGSNNPRKAKLYHLYHSELPKIVSQVEQMYKAETKRLSQ